MITQLLIKSHYLFENSSDDDFYSINTDVINNESHRGVIETVFDTFRYTEYDMCNYQTDVDNNYYNDITISCKYFTDQQFNNDISIHNDGHLYLIHFNARSLVLTKLNIFFNYIQYSLI